VEGRRDPDAAPSACCRPARAASRSFEVDVAGPGVAGPARRDAASRPAGRDAVPPGNSIVSLTCSFRLRGWCGDGWLARCCSRSSAC
jgi:hypothetical protein